MGWTLNDVALYGYMGQGWSISAPDQPQSVLDWTQTIDLTWAQAPRLRFVSQMRSLLPSAGVQISVDHGISWQFLGIAMSSDIWTETVIDLSAYRGQVIQLQWVWLSPENDPSAFWLLDHVMIDEAPIVLPTLTPFILPTHVPVESIVIMESPTPMELIVEMPTLIPVEIPVELPTEIPMVTQEPF